MTVTKPARRAAGALSLVAASWLLVAAGAVPGDAGGVAPDRGEPSAAVVSPGIDRVTAPAAAPRVLPWAALLAATPVVVVTVAAQAVPRPALVPAVSRVTAPQRGRAPPLLHR